jgi:autotransporter-associated beta strand protein
LTLLALLLGPGLFKTPAATFTWSGASGSDQYWSTPGNWNPAGPPAAEDVAFFNDDGATTVAGDWNPNNRLSASHTVANLIYGNTNGFHNTILEPGVTLTISNGVAGQALLVGTGVDNGKDQIVTATISGTGASLVVVSANAGSQFNVRQGSATSGAHRATLDLYGLDTLDVTVGRLLVGGDGSASSVAAHNRPAGTLIMAKTNTIRLFGGAPSLNSGDSGGTQGTSFIELGMTNAIFTDSMTIARQKCIATLRFNSMYTGLNPALFLRGTTGDRVLAMALGDNSAQTTSSVRSEGTVDLSAGTVDAMVDTCYLGRGMNGTGTGQGTGTLTLGAGVFDANNLYLGYVNIGTAAAKVTGTVNVTGTATLLVNDTLQLGRNPGTTNALGKGVLNISDSAAVRVLSITTTTNTEASQILMQGGTLALTNSAGTPEAPLSDVQLYGGTLELVVRKDSTNIVTQGGASSGITVNILSLPLTTAYPVAYPLISYSWGSFDGQLGSLPAGSPPYQGYISNSWETSTLYLVITSGPDPQKVLTWNGTPTGDWDTTTANWLASGNPSVYRDVDEITFDDSATGTTTVNLTTTLMPYSMTVNNSTKPYTFTGPGGLSGTNGLVKQGAGTLTVANSGVNDFIGGVSIEGGTIQLDGSADRLPTHTDVILADQAGAELDLNNLDQTIASLSGGGSSGGSVTLGSGTLTFADGSGQFSGVISGAGSVVKTNAGNQVLAGANLYSGGTLVTGGQISVANETGSGTGSGFVQVETNATFAIGAGGPAGSVAVPVITNNGTVRLDRSDDFTLATTIVGWGNVTKANTNTLLVPISNTYTGVTTISGGALRVSHPEALGDTTGQTSIPNVPYEARLELIGNVTLPEPIRLSQKQTAAGVSPCIVNVSGTNTLAGVIEAVTGGSYWTFRPDDGLLIVSGDFVNTTTAGARYLRLFGEAAGDWQTDFANNPTNNGSVNHLHKADGGTWTLSANNTYNGGTAVGGGVLLVNGAILNSTGVLVTNGTLGGTGLIQSPVTVDAEGKLAPGASIGTLTISNTLTLNGGTTEMEVSSTGADKVAGLTSVTLGGTLKIVVTGTLNGTEVFKLFEAGSYSGDFATYDLPPLESPLDWNKDSVPVDGTLRVIGGVEPPHIGTGGLVADGNFQITGTGPTGAGYRILAATNVAQPLVEWLQLDSGTFSGGAFSFTDLTATNYLRRFYRVVTP